MQRRVRTVAARGLVGLAIKNRDRRVRKDYKKKLGSRLAPKAGRMTMEQCSANLLKATLDPFGPVNDVCIPFGNSRPSQKIRALIRGSSAISTTGFGFIAISPTFVTDAAFAFVSQAAWTGSAIDCLDANVATLVVPTGYATAFYDAAGIINQGRICAVGLRVKYTGSELNKQGQVYALATPDRVSVEGMTTSSLGEFAETQVVNFGREWVTLSTVAQEDTEWDYSPAAGVSTTSTIYPMSAGVLSSSAASGAPIMCLMVTGKAGETFAYEIVVYTETIGKTVQGLTTRNSNDIEGLGKVVQIASRVPALVAQGMKRAQAIRLAIGETADMINRVVDIAKLAL